LFLAVSDDSAGCSSYARISLRRRVRGIELERLIMSHAVEDDVEERLLKLETDVAHIRVSVGELKGEIKDLRTEVKGEIRDLRAEVSGEIKELRNDMTALKDSLTGQIAALRVDMVMTKVWMLCTSAAMLGVMARGFHWI
jgi:uncharacterized coiled-coil DUF342 family protein